MRIIGWSGPRNLSTAMMYAFGARADCMVTDEPFYAAFLAATGDDHPMRDAVLAVQPTDPVQVAAACAAEPDTPLWYQKHMCHHMLPDFPLDWTAGARHLFLIRHPARVIASYARKRAMPGLDDLGYRRQAELHVRLGGPVLDSVTIRRDPRGALSAACHALGIGFDPAMLSWPKGGRPEDGVWAAHWYDAVHDSTGFAAPESEVPRLDGAYAALAERAMPYYEALRAQALLVG